MSSHDRRNLREFQRYSNRLNRMLEDGSLEGNPRQSRLVTRVRSLYRGLLGIVPEVTLRQILAAGAVVVLGLGVVACKEKKSTDGDTSTDVIEDTVTDMESDTLVDGEPDVVPDVVSDVDPDADPDVMPDADPDADPDVDPDAPEDVVDDEVADVGSDATDVIDEEVTAVTPSFATVRSNPFGLTPWSADYSSVAIGDIDGDGDLDLFMASWRGGVEFHENTGTATAPAFAAPTTGAFGLAASTEIEGIDLADIDGDGDLDLFSADYNYGGTGMQYVLYENTGTATAPALGGGTVNPFGLTAPIADYIYPQLVDLDGDGDLDILSTDTGHLLYLQNTGTVTAPAFAAPTTDPYGLSGGTTFTAPAPSDLDLDGDMDILVGSYGYTSAGLNYFESDGASTPTFTGPSALPFGLTAPYYYAFPEFADLDGDGDDDLIVAEYNSNLLYFENTSI